MVYACKWLRIIDIYLFIWYNPINSCVSNFPAWNESLRFSLHIRNWLWMSCSTLLLNNNQTTAWMIMKLCRFDLLYAVHLIDVRYVCGICFMWLVVAITAACACADAHTLCLLKMNRSAGNGLGSLGHYQRFPYNMNTECSAKLQSFIELIHQRLILHECLRVDTIIFASPLGTCS